MLASMNRLTLSFLFSLIILAGCGSGVLMASGTSAQITVAVAGTNQITLGTPVQYTASIAGSTNTAVTWSISGPSASDNYGSISGTGLYTPPPAVPVHTQFQIVATSQADATKTSSTLVTLTNPVPAIASVSFAAGYHSSFLVDVQGSNFMPSSAVVDGYGRQTTYVSPTELQFTLTNPPAPGTAISISVLTPGPGRTQSSSYSATVPAAVGVTLAGPQMAVAGTTTPMQYTATVTNTQNTAVTWSLSGASAAENYGTISSTGLYTPPPTVPVHSGVTIIATSQADTTKSASQGVGIQNPVPAISSASLTPAANGSFLVDVKGSNFIAASIASPGPYGVPTTYVSANELKFTLTNPPSVGSAVALTVTNPSPGKTQSSAYSLVIPGSVTVAVTGSAVASIGTPLQYTASVSGTQNTAVTWTIKGASVSEDYGTISASGLYTPPLAVPVHTSIWLVATSQADTTKSNAVNVTLQEPVPAITSATLAVSAKGSYLVDLLGSNFVPTSSIVPGTYGVPTTYISSNHLQFTLTNPPAAGGSVPVWVINPAPGRTQSATFTLLISTKVSVAVTGPAQAAIGTPVQYAATVSGAANTAVTWTISGPSATENYGTVSPSGLYTPPSSVPVHTQFNVVATSQADTTKSASELITLSNPVPVISSASLTAGYHSSFLVDVLGSNFLPASAVLYLGYGANTTYVSPTHLQFTIANPPAAGTIEPIGVVNPAPGRTQSANYNLTIPAPVGVSVSGAPQATVGTPTQFTATVTGTQNSAVTWTVGGASAAENYGTISAAGLYAPPTVVPAHNVITVYATSKADTTKWSSTAVTLLNTVPVIASAVASAGSHGQVVIDVKGANFLTTSCVMFSGYGLATTYVSAGELTAVLPSSTAAAQTAGAPISISVATPNPGKTVSAPFSVSLPGQVSVVVTGSAIVATGTPSLYVATVTGSPNTAVTWSVKTSDGSEAGSISASGLYMPPATIAANKAVTVTATSQAQPGSSGAAAVTLVSVSVPSAVRLLDQSSFGPTDSLINHVQTIGLSNYIDEQLALPPTLLAQQNTFTGGCAMNPTVCMDEDYWHDIITAPDQLRQRVSMALQEILVVSYNETNTAMTGAYSNTLTQDAFANWSTIMKDVTLSPGMGRYLNMVNSGKQAPGVIANENFARENMQLFNLGLNLLNQDGTLQTDGSGNPIPAYTEANVEAFSRVFTGWTWATPAGVGQTFPNWNANPYVPMVAIESAHDTTQKVLLNTTLPAGQSAEQDLNGAIQDVFNHPNVGPFVTRQLIQHLVKSNPSPSYVARIAGVFANDGNGVRGNMAAVIKAILLDPEARAGDSVTATVANDGYLREPILWVANVLRGLNVVPKGGVTDNTAYTSIDYFSGSQQQNVFNSPTVFNYYPASYDLAATGLNAPQFALETSATIMQKLTLANNVVNNQLGELWVDLSATSPLGVLATASNDLLLEELNKIFLHGTMSTQMKTAIETALSGLNDPAQRVRTAVYLVITSSQYKVIH